jgi:23S rRNA pseudouridine2605 synthase
MALERLQKIIAAAGIASRRKAEELIQQGLVSVNGKMVTELGTKADADTDSIRVNDKLLKGAERHEYVAMNKPRGYVTTVSDPEGRPTVMELVRSKARLYPIGRLDFNSEGLLLLTNDGDLAHKLMKAASHIPKTYLVKVAGQPKEEDLRRLRIGVSIAEERNPARRIRTAPAQIRVIKEAENPWLEVTLHEGRNRQIRKMFEEVGHHVEKIRRVRYGPLELDLPPGESRMLSPKEISQLRHATESHMQQRFRAHDGGPRFPVKRPDSSSRFQAVSGGARPRQEKKDWKSKESSESREKSYSSARPRRFQPRKDHVRPGRRASQFGAAKKDEEAEPKPFSRARRDDRPSGEYQGRRHEESDSRSARGERDFRSRPVADRRGQNDRSKSRSQNRNRGTNRFSRKKKG